MTINSGAPRASGSARTHIEVLLSDYPNVSSEELQILLRWFKNASGQDIRLIAQNEYIRRGYQRFRADHVDNFAATDWIKAILFAAIAIVLISGIGYLVL